ncbi:hypothetical protein SDC9_168704 [bioreactor metagenome]|uniref:Uncharacterized protein n=1 Tax=bioreactor metagenome TaxID=1076179 RepID=A0A645G3V1_9ZZZZ
MEGFTVAILKGEFDGWIGFFEYIHQILEIGSGGFIRLIEEVIYRQGCYTIPCILGLFFGPCCKQQDGNQEQRNENNAEEPFHVHSNPPLYRILHRKESSNYAKR